MIIAGSFHPIRWTLSISVGLPLGLLVLAALCGLAHRSDLARIFLRGSRYVVLLDLVLAAAVATWGFVYERSSSARDRSLRPAPGKMVDLGGYRLHLYCTGEGGPTVVFDHGLSSSYLAWHSVQPEVAKFTRVCSYDRAGNGWSDRSSKPRTTKIMAEELDMLLANGGEAPPFVMVGHSAGALDVVSYAREYPGKVAGLVLVDGSHPDQKFSFPFSQKLSVRLLQWTAPFGLPRWRKWNEEGIEELGPLKRGFAYDPRIFKTEYDERSALANPERENRKLDPVGDLPVVVISRDPSSNRESRRVEWEWARLQQDLLRLSPNSTQIIATGSGHAVNLERPDIVVHAIHDVVAQVRSRQVSK